MLNTPDPRRWWALALLCGAFFMVLLDATIVLVALPSIQGDIGFSAQGLQWVLSAYALTFGGLLLLGGRAADLLGRRRLFGAGPGGQCQGLRRRGPMLRNIGETACSDPTTRGAPVISRWLPVVVGNGHDLQARRGLLEGAMHAVARVSELAAMAGPSRLRDYEVPRQNLPELARESRSARRRRPTHARRRRTQCSNCWRRCDGETQERDEQEHTDFHHPRRPWRWHLTTPTEGEPKWQRSS